MNKIGKILTLLVILLFVAVIIIRIIPPKSDGHIADTNGAEVIALNTITDADIAAMSGTSVGLGVRNSSSSDATVCYSERFSGVETLYDAEAACTVTLSDITVTSGNLRVVVLLDNQIVHDFPMNGSAPAFDMPAGSSLRIAGESAAFELAFELQ